MSKQPLRLKRRDGRTVQPPPVDPTTARPADMMPIAFNLVVMVDDSPVATLPMRGVIPRPQPPQGTEITLRMDGRALVAQLAAVCGFVPDSTPPAPRLWTPKD